MKVGAVPRCIHVYSWIEFYVVEHSELKCCLLREQLEDYATLRGYIRVEDNDKYVVNEQRVCWEPPRKTMVCHLVHYPFLYQIIPKLLFLHL